MVIRMASCYTCVNFILYEKSQFLYLKHLRPHGFHCQAGLISSWMNCVIHGSICNSKKGKLAFYVNHYYLEMTPGLCVNFLSHVTFCHWLQVEKEPQTAYPMPIAWTSQMTNVVLTQDAKLTWLLERLPVHVYKRCQVLTLLITYY